MSANGAPRLTRRMRMHLTGSGRSCFNYDVLLDGQPAGVTQVVETNGAPEYKRTANELHNVATGDVLDLMEPDHEPVTEWVLARVPKMEADR